jgi:broad specificity phosphatase PhoE
MLQFVLIRPGATEFDQQARIQGTLDIPLCEEGRREAAAIVDELRGLPIEAVYSAPCQSAEETAGALGAVLGLKPKALAELSNLNLGLWQGMLIADVKTKQPRVYRQWQEQPETVCPPQGETIRAARQRVQVALAKLAKKHKSEGLVAVVAPEPLASIFRQAVSGEPLGDLWRGPQNAAPSWERIDVPEPMAAK